MGLLDRIRACQNDDSDTYLPFHVAGVAIGHIKGEFVPSIARFGDVFDIDETSVALMANLRSYEERTQAMARVLDELRNEGLIPG